MEKIRQMLLDNIVVCEYNRLRVFGIEGRLHRPLEEVAKIPDSVEFGPVEECTERNILPGFCLTPIVDIIISRAYDRQASIVTYSLRMKESGKVLDRIIKKSGFIQSKPTPRFIETIDFQVRAERDNYKIFEVMSEKLKADLELVFGAMRYHCFLTRQGVSREDSLKLVSKLFSIPQLAAERQYTS